MTPIQTHQTRRLLFSRRRRRLACRFSLPKIRHHHRFHSPDSIYTHNIYIFTVIYFIETIQFNQKKLCADIKAQDYAYNMGAHGCG